MGYIKVEYQKILNILDTKNTLPNGWSEFVKKQTIPQNLIIKHSKNNCYCTNCKNYFFSKKKVNDTAKCPHCHNKYLIKRSNLKYYEFKDYLSILDRINNTFVVRYFELKTIIDAQHNTDYSVVEFAREIPSRSYRRSVVVNNRVSRCQCHIYISHSNYCAENKWREYTRNYSLIDYSIVFPNNIKKLMQNTEHQYSCIWEIAKHCSYIDIIQLIQNTSELKRVELLAKMKLYNLSLVAGQFKSYGTFKEIFGVSKDFYPFMKRYNITYNQLKILKLLQEKDINKIRYLENYLGFGGSTANLEDVARYISLNRLIEYSKLQKREIDLYNYKDYLRFAKSLRNKKKNKKYLFPKDLKAEHDKLERQYKIQEQSIIQNAIIKRGKLLSINKFNDNVFVISPAPSLKALQNESKQQNNCVRTYAEKYANGECDIYFMRDIKNKKKSLVTVEVRNNIVVQSRIKNNRSPNENQLKFLNIWEQNILKGAA